MKKAVVLTLYYRSTTKATIPTTNMGNVLHKVLKQLSKPTLLEHATDGIKERAHGKNNMAERSLKEQMEAKIKEIIADEMHQSHDEMKDNNIQTFTVFPNLPFELRIKIYKDLLPKPRNMVVYTEWVTHYTYNRFLDPYTGCYKDYISSVVHDQVACLSYERTMLFEICQESRKIANESHPHCFETQLGGRAVPFSSHDKLIFPDRKYWRRPILIFLMIMLRFITFLNTFFLSP